MNILKYIIVSLVLMPIIFLSSIQLVGLNESWYKDWHKNKFSEFNITGAIDEQRLEAQVNNLFLYLNNQAELNNYFYTEREILHLFDIKDIISRVKTINGVLIITIFLILTLVLLTSRFLGLAKTTFFASLISLMFYLVTIGLTVFNFDKIFLIFHQLLFTNDYWLLDPNIHSLIVIFPPNLFFDLTLQIIYLAVALNLILLISSGFIFIGIKTFKLIVN